MQIRKNKSFYMFPLITILLALFVAPSEGKECDCVFFEKSLKELERLFDSVNHSQEKDSELLYLECLNKTSKQAIFQPYCKDLAASSKRPQREKVHDRKVQELKGLIKDCNKSGSDCEGWREKLSNKCSSLEGDLRGDCFMGKNLLKEFRSQFPSEAKTFIESSKEQKRNIKDFLHAKKRVCERKYSENITKKERCIANFRKKYHIASTLKPAYKTNEQKSAHKTVKKAEKETKEATQKELESFMIGVWQNPEIGDFFEIKKVGRSLKIICIVGCGNGVKYKWLKNYNFSRKYSRTKRHGTGFFDEKCRFDRIKKEYACNGMMRTDTKFGTSDTKRLREKHYFKLVNFK